MPAVEGEACQSCPAGQKPGVLLIGLGVLGCAPSSVTVLVSGLWNKPNIQVSQEKDSEDGGQRENHHGRSGCHDACHNIFTLTPSMRRYFCNRETSRVWQELTALQTQWGAKSSFRRGHILQESSCLRGAGSRGAGHRLKMSSLHSGVRLTGLREQIKYKVPALETAILLWNLLTLG